MQCFCFVSIYIFICYSNTYFTELQTHILMFCSYWAGTSRFKRSHDTCCLKSDLAVNNSIAVCRYTRGILPLFVVWALIRLDNGSYLVGYHKWNVLFWYNKHLNCPINTALYWTFALLLESFVRCTTDKNVIGWRSFLFPSPTAWT